MSSKLNLHVGVWLLVEALSILSYTVKSSRLRLSLFVGIVATCTYGLMCTTTDFRRYGMGVRGISSRFPMIVLFVSSNILLCDPHKDLRRVGQKGSIHDAPFLSRLWWGLLTWSNPRGINYAHEPTPALPPRPRQTTRTMFVVAQLKSIIWYFLPFDILGIINRANPYYTKDTPIVAGFQHLWWLAGFGFGAMIYTLTSIQYKILAIILVVLRISNPRECPDFYDSPFDAYTVCRMWSKSWHHIEQGLHFACRTRR
ncbi:hypothetical protein HYPSUDRAFT_70638 [Hypholoma sublateritium FD-334 SS-4]|uniref:Wax synthase domain-containing protein n=1 Tax=Hypholoma sublateritium (strain FD-334 SS-4) TaxID=945553 RepID=A0A0D2M2X6_HYPSF|nr:hypothetical protein HYPSUDRAFT_70638 [Hypholoma sublateritium FD-334 SS-4]